MNINKEKHEKCKSVLAFGMVLVTSVAFNGCAMKEASTNSSTVGINASVDSKIVDDLLVAQTDTDKFILFCPENRGICVNYETEEFMFMYGSAEDFSNKLEEYFNTSVETEKIKPHLIENYGDKNSYSYTEIFTTFDSLKTNSKNK